MRRLAAPPMQVQRGYLPFPDRYRCRLPWSYTTGLTTNTLNTIGVITYRLNGPYDPDVAAGGSQPQSWDQLAAVGYTRYRCTGAKVTLTFVDPRGDNYWYGYRVRRSTEASPAGEAIDVFRMKKFSYLACMNNSGSQVRRISFYVSPNTIFGETRSQLWNDTEYDSAIASTPTKQVYLDVVCGNQTASAVSTNVMIDIVYYTTLSGLVAFPAS